MRIYYVKDSLYGKTVPIEADSKEHAQEQYIDFCEELGMRHGELTIWRRV